MFDMLVGFWDWSPVLFLLVVAIIAAVSLVALAISIYVLSICRERGFKAGIEDLKSGLCGASNLGEGTAEIQSHNPFGG